MNTVFTRFIVIMVCVTIGLIGYFGTAQAEDAPALEWNINLVNSGAFNWIGDMTIDQQGNVYVTGWKNNPMTVIAVAKLSPSGEVLWVSYGNSYPQYPCQSGASGNKIKVDSTGNTYITGNCSSGGLNQDIFAAKFSQEGEMLWLSGYVVTDNVYGYTVNNDIAVDTNGSVYVTGSVPVYGSHVLNRITTVKFDSQGKTQWVRQYNLKTYSMNLAIGSDNSVFVSGVSGPCDYAFCQNSQPEWLLLKYDQSGNLVNEQLSPIWGTPSRMVQDAEGNLYVAGISGPSRADQSYYTVIKYNSSGDKLWVAQHGSGFSTIITSAAVDNKDGSLYLTGGIYKSSGVAGRLLKFDSLLNFIWSKEVEYSQSMMYEVILDSYGNVYATGNANNTIFTAKYDDRGNLIWNLQPAISSSFISMRLGNNGQSIYLCDAKGVKKFEAVNQKPVANAGTDKTMECAGPQGAVVALDGSGSSDQNGETLTYVWTDHNGVIATGVKPEVALSLGVHTITLTVDDGKGGTDLDNVVVTVQDKTPPSTIVANSGGIPGENGWYRSDVAITLESLDACSGVKEIRYVTDGVERSAAGNRATLEATGDGMHNLNYYARDNAGNSETAHPLFINIDMTRPAITASVTPPPNAKGWYNTDVTITFTCSDSPSGIAVCPDPIIVATEGTGQKFIGTTKDKAGNTAETQMTVNLDKTPPVLNLSVVPGMLWPPNHKMVDVMIAGEAVDAVSKQVSTVFTVIDEYGNVEPKISGFQRTIPLEAWREGADKDGRFYTIRVEAIDAAGNQSSASTAVLVPHDMR